MSKWEMQAAQQNEQGANSEREAIERAGENFRKMEDEVLGPERPEGSRRKARMGRIFRVLSLAASMFAVSESAHAVELLYNGDKAKPLTTIEIAIKDRKQDETASRHILEAVQHRDARAMELSEKVKKFGEVLVIHPDHHRYRGLAEEELLIDGKGHVLGRLLSETVNMSDQELEEQVPMIMANTGHVKGGTPLVFQSEAVLEKFVGSSLISSQEK